MKRVLYVCPSSGVGGAETFIKQTFVHGDKSQFDNHYLLFRAGPLFDELQKLGATVHLLKKPPKLSKKADRKLVQDKLFELINQNNYQVVHSTMAYGALFTARACKKMKVPHVWFQHGPASGWMDRLAAILPHNGLIVNSHYTGKTQRRLENPVRFLIPRQNPIEKILLGTEEISFDSPQVEAYKKSIATEKGFDPDCLFIGMLCRIQEWKGVHVFVEAIKQLQSDDSLPAFQGIVWGEAFNGDDYLKQLQQQVQDNSLPIQFMGHTHNASLSMASCEIVVNASVQPEPFGLSIIEGMMVGAVPVVPDEGGPIEIVSNGKDGLIFKARQAPSLANKLKTLLKDANLRSKLSENAQAVARQKYNAQRVIGHLEKFHQKIMG